VTIGEGAFGKVKLGINRETSERFAVKIMDKKEIREQDQSAQVRRAIYIMRSLSHNHILRMDEMLTSNTKLYIVMELVTGGELFDRLERHERVDETLARQYFQQLVDGVDLCHKSGVAHRDLKPENLLVDANGDIKITDFAFSAMKSVDANAVLLYSQCGTLSHGTPYSSLVPSSESASSAVSTASAASDRGSVHSVNSLSAASPSSPGHHASRARRSEAPSPQRASLYTRTFMSLSRKPYGEIDHSVTSVIPVVRPAAM
jgi:serine/threonine protein kinase